MNKSYGSISGRNKFSDIFSGIVGALLGITLAVSITETFFSFDFKVYPKKIVVFFVCFDNNSVCSLLRCYAA